MCEPLRQHCLGPSNTFSVDKASEFVAILIEAQADHDEAVVPCKCLVGRLQVRDFSHTRTAPSRPEIQQDTFSPQIGQLEFFAIQGLEIEVWGHGANFRAIGVRAVHPMWYKPQAVATAFPKRVGVDKAVSRAIIDASCRFAPLKRAHIRHRGKTRTAHLRGSLARKANVGRHERKPRFRDESWSQACGLGPLRYRCQKAGGKARPDTVSPSQDLKRCFLKEGSCWVGIVRNLDGLMVTRESVCPEAFDGNIRDNGGLIYEFLPAIPKSRKPGSLESAGQFGLSLRHQP